METSLPIKFSEDEKFLISEHSELLPVITKALLMAQRDLEKKLLTCSVSDAVMYRTQLEGAVLLRQAFARVVSSGDVITEDKWKMKISQQKIQSSN